MFNKINGKLWSIANFFKSCFVQRGFQNKFTSKFLVYRHYFGEFSWIWIFVVHKLVLVVSPLDQAALFRFFFVYLLLWEYFSFYFLSLLVLHCFATVTGSSSDRGLRCNPKLETCLFRLSERLIKKLCDYCIFSQIDSCYSCPMFLGESRVDRPKASQWQTISFNIYWLDPLK